MQAIERYRALVAQVAQDVSTAAREVNTTWAEIAARRAARFAAESSLRAVQARREQDEALTPTFVRLILDTEERLANAQSEEELAIQRYNVAIARLERAKGTLLRYNNVVLEEENLPG